MKNQASKKLNLVLSFFLSGVVLLGAANLQAQPAPDAKPAAPAPAPVGQISDAALYKEVLTNCDLDITTLLDKFQFPRETCRNIEPLCMNATYNCLKTKTKCESAPLPDGSKGVRCATNDLSECRLAAFAAIDNTFAADPGFCKNTDIDVSAPGCGNQVVEIGEDCDAGPDNGKPGVCNAECRTAGTPLQNQGGGANAGEGDKAAAAPAAGGGCRLNAEVNFPSGSGWLAALGMTLSLFFAGRLLRSLRSDL